MSDKVPVEQLECDEITTNAVIENVDNSPPFLLNVALSFQAVFAHALSIIFEPLILLSTICLLPDDPSRSKFISLTIFFSGLSTILQATVGVKLPVISTPSRVYMAAIVLILSDERWKCPNDGDLYAMGPVLRAEQFSIRSREIRGAFIIVTLLQIAIIFSGVSVITSKLISLPTLATVMISSSLSNIKRSISHMTTGLSFLTLFLLILLFYLQNITVPIPKLKRGALCSQFPLKIFKLLPIFAVIFGYLFYLAVFKIEEGDDTLERLVDSIDLFPVSMFGFFEVPTCSFKTILFIVVAVIIQNFMSVIYFSMIAHITGNSIKSPQVTRGLGVEIVCGLFSSIFGVPLSVNTEPYMVGVISMTEVRNNRVCIIAGVWLMLFAVLVKPLFFFVFFPIQSFYAFNILIQGIIMAAGFSSITGSTKRSSVITSISVAIGLVVPQWFQLEKYGYAIFMESQIWISAVASFILDLTWPEFQLVEG